MVAKGINTNLEYCDVQVCWDNIYHTVWLYQENMKGYGYSLGCIKSVMLHIFVATEI